MCEFCTKYGEGKKWYENIKNYTEEVFHQVNSEEHLRSYLKDFSRPIREDTAQAYSWKKRFPRIYNLIAYPLITRHLKKTHFGQIVPVEEIENKLGQCASVVRLPCVCRKVTIGDGKRYCLGIGMDLTKIFRDIGIALGLLQDLGSGSLIGFSGLTLGIVGLFIGFLGRRVLDIRRPSNSIFIGLLGIAGSILAALFLELTYGSVPLLGLFFARMVPRAVTTALAGYGILRLVTDKHVLALIRRRKLQKEL